MAAQDFVNQLRQLGHLVAELGAGRISFPYVVESGKFVDQPVELGFVLSGDFPVNPPSCLRVSPRLLPIASGGSHPAGAVQVCDDFGPNWEYWSRPLSHWAKTDRTARAVMAHVRHLFDTQ